jgi:phosphoribosylpyrophosphate synthetase
VDSLSAAPLLARTVALRQPEATVIVLPDTGRVKMATEYAHGSMPQSSCCISGMRAGQRLR